MELDHTQIRALQLVADCGRGGCQTHAGEHLFSVVDVPVRGDRRSEMTDDVFGPGVGDIGTHLPSGEPVSVFAAAFAAVPPGRYVLRVERDEDVTDLCGRDEETGELGNVETDVELLGVVPSRG